MGETPSDRRNWLIAAWPGMGNVAVICAAYLIRKLGLEPAAEMPPQGRFDVGAIEVRAGVIAAPTVPRSVFYRAPGSQPGDPGLTVFLADGQPAVGAYGYAHELLERAKTFQINRVMTFASMASPMHPSQDPRVLGATTQADLLADLKRGGVSALEDGQIGGLNGVLLGAAAQRGMAGICLLGEMPFFAVNVPNPKASKAVLEIFSKIAGVDIDLTELAEDAERVDAALVQLLERMQEQARQQREEDGDDDDEEIVEPDGVSAEPASSAKPSEKSLDFNARQRIEELFEKARKDRSQALALKNELDRLKVFKQYENRFLDLFKRAE